MIKPFYPPRESKQINVKQLKEIIQNLPDDMLVTIDDFDFIFWEIDYDENRIDFCRDYKGD